MILEGTAVRQKATAPSVRAAPVGMMRAGRLEVMVCPADRNIASISRSRVSCNRPRAGFPIHAGWQEFRLGKRRPFASSSRIAPL